MLVPLKRATSLWTLAAVIVSLFTLNFFRVRVDHETHSSAPVAINALGTPKRPLSSWNPFSKSPPVQNYHHVAIATTFGPHFEVYIPLAWTFRKLLTQPHQTVKVYSDGLGGKYADVMKATGMYQEDLIRVEKLLGDMENPMLYENDPGAMIDVVVFGTCEIDMARHHTKLLQIWEARPADKKFQVVCIVHNVGSAKNWFKLTADWAQRGAIRLVSISEHVAHSFRDEVSKLADEPDPDMNTALFEYIKIDLFYPIVPLPLIMAAQHRYPNSKGLAHAAIIGNYQQGRRDYKGTFEDLHRLLQLNPSGWGYLPANGANGTYEPDPNSVLSPFKLHLVGAGKLDVPEALKNIVMLHTHLDYPDFFAVIQSMDLVLPAFSRNGGYFELQSSSAVHVAMLCETPMLATHRLRAAYKYVDDDQVLVTRPQAVREMDAILALRTGSTAHISNKFHLPEFTAAVKDMQAKGWKRSPAGFAALKARVWAHDEDVVWRILRGL